jgi:antitoxin ParD1/3/4
LLEEHETKLATLRAALIEGEQSGPSEPFDFDRFLEGKRTRQPE